MEVITRKKAEVDCGCAHLADRRWQAAEAHHALGNEYRKMKAGYTEKEFDSHHSGKENWHVVGESFRALC